MGQVLWVGGAPLESKFPSYTRPSGPSGFEKAHRRPTRTGLSNKSEFPSYAQVRSISSPFPGEARAYAGLMATKTVVGDVPTLLGSSNKLEFPQPWTICTRFLRMEDPVLHSGVEARLSTTQKKKPRPPFQD